MITREWYLFLQGIFDRVGGASGQSSTDLTQDMPDDAGLEEVKSTLFSTQDAFGQSPLPAEMQATLDALQAELSVQRDQIAELLKTVQDLQQGIII
jgi:hypothetical protein